MVNVQMAVEEDEAMADVRGNEPECRIVVTSFSRSLLRG